MKMNLRKAKVRLIEETSDIVKLEFPFVEIPVTMSKRYFKKMMETEEFDILNIKEN